MFRSFKQPNLEDGAWECPLCQTKDVRPVVLMPIKGTEDGTLVTCRQIHEDCLAYGIKQLLAQE